MDKKNECKSRLIENKIYSHNYSHNNINLLSNNIYNKLNRENTKYKLPDDWRELYDKKTGKKYYACITTKHTQWLHPCIPIGTMMKNNLPYGWDYDIDPKTNDIYYINHVGRFTTWSPPVKQRRYKGDEYSWELN